MPRRSDLKGTHGHISAAIVKFGGPEKVAHELGYSYTARKKWPSVEALRPYLEPLVMELGRMPTQELLQERDLHDLEGAVIKFGGFPTVAKALGYPGSGYQSWPSPESLRPHLEPLAEQLGHMPSRVDLALLGRGDLARAISKFGGYPAIAAMLGLPYVPAPERASARQAERILSGDAFKPSRLERSAASLLEPLGFHAQRIRRGSHTFDYAHVTEPKVVEINGCYWHDHHVSKHSCPVRPVANLKGGGTPRQRDEHVRMVARKHGLALLELWECERTAWEVQILKWLDTLDGAPLRPAT